MTFGEITFALPPFLVLIAAKTLVIVSLGGEELLVVVGAEYDMVVNGECFGPAKVKS